MSGAFTPGPWTWSGRFVWAGDVPVAAADPAGKTRDAAIANAALLASAPDLLAACEAALRELEEWQSDTDREVKAQLKAALARARSGR